PLSLSPRHRREAVPWPNPPSACADLPPRPSATERHTSGYPDRPHPKSPESVAHLPAWRLLSCSNQQATSPWCQPCYIPAHHHPQTIPPTALAAVAVGSLRSPRYPMLAHWLYPPPWTQVSRRRAWRHRL